MSSNRTLIKDVCKELVEMAYNIANAHVNGFIPKHEDICKINALYILSAISSSDIAEDLPRSNKEQIVNTYNNVVYGN